MPSRISRPLADYKDVFILDAHAENPIYHARGEGVPGNHLRWDWYTACGKLMGKQPWSLACLPRWRARIVARPCKRCYPSADAERTNSMLEAIRA